MLVTIQSKNLCLPASDIKNVKIKIYKTTISPVGEYGCETWSLMLRDKYKSRMFENRALRPFEPKRVEVTRH
jgi:hypothetical protein